MTGLWMFIGAIFILACVTAGYIAWRDRGKRRHGGGPRFDGHGEGKSAAYLAGYDRGIDGGGGA